MNNLKSLIFVFFTLVLMSGCTVKYVAEYDAAIKDEIVEVAKKVDLFWGKLKDTEKDKRTYDAFKDDYNAIEADIRALVLKNKIRALNEESTKQAGIALQLWTEDREKHKADNGFSDTRIKLHQSQFTRVFSSMARGEAAKE